MGPPPAPRLPYYPSLGVSDPDGRVLWSTPGAGSTSSSSSSPPALLTNEGNLVVRSPNGTVVWQSFDHPTDTFVPGMKVRLSHLTGEGNRIVSWKSPGDPAAGSFSYGLDPGTSLQLLMWNGTRPYWRTPVWKGYAVASMYLSAGTVLYTAIVDTEEEISIAFTLSGGAAPTRVGFVPMPTMKVPDKFSLDAGNRSAEECAARCAANCSCEAYAYANLQSSSAKGELSRCIVWAGELVDAQMIGPRWGGETLYLRVPVAAASTSPGIETS
ncbi:G-type lectin S-receptor-like serine/threonine-protein kinase RKS1 [Triticum urartu]|uniref:non-specific serine/threonine protein kinase n=1 Tax=Triticum urartu TaxID=4572 RepID=M7ZXQ8_TRIUA|nr:G-type lectin S-receptor-like serine/threonine-protein kinase RKS1 [Triticum urartu]